MKSRMYHKDDGGRIRSNRSLVIIFEVESAYDGVREGVFAGTFYNEDTKVHSYSKVKGVRHYRWLQGPMNHLLHER